MVCVLGMCAARNQIEPADAGALNISATETIANSQSVFGVELIVEARVDSETPLPRPKHVRERIDYRQRLWIESDCIDDRAVIHVVAPNIKKERRAFVNSSGYAAAIFLQKKWRLL